MLMEARLLDERREGVAKAKQMPTLLLLSVCWLRAAYSLEVIAELTNLSLADVEKLKEES